MTLSTEAQAAKNALASSTIKATRARRRGQRPVTRSLKLDQKSLTLAQKEALTRLFLEAKWYTNHLIANKAWLNGREESKAKSVRVKSHRGAWREESFRHLGSQVKQSIADQLITNELALETLDSRGHQKPGTFKLRHFVNTVPLSQHGVTYKLSGSKLALQKMPGKYRVFGVKQLTGLELSSAKLTRRPDGYYLIVTGWKDREKQESIISRPSLGLDLGVKSHFTLSDGREYTVTHRESDRLRGLQKKLKRQQRGSRGYQATRQAIRREYQKLNNRKADAGNKFAQQLLSEGRVFTQDDRVAEWKRRSGKSLQHGITGRVKSRLKQDPSSVFLPYWVPTTQWCSRCGAKNKHGLDQRQYSCPCGYTAPRDVHAARNMVILGKLWLTQQSGQELASTPVEGLSVKALESATALLAPRKREALGKEVASVGGGAVGSPEARLASAVA